MTYVAAKDGTACLGIRLPATAQVGLRLGPRQHARWQLDHHARRHRHGARWLRRGHQVHRRRDAGNWPRRLPVQPRRRADLSAPSSRLATAFTITPGSAFATTTGLTVSLGGSGKVVEHERPRHLLVLGPHRPRSSPRTLVANGSSTATYVLSGTPNDGYLVQLKWVTGGTVGTQGASYQISLDGGQHVRRRRPQARDGHDHRHPRRQDEPFDGDHRHPLTSAQIITAGDLLAFGTTAPEFAYSDLQTLITNLRGTPLVWSFIGALRAHGCLRCGIAPDSLLTGWATGTRRTWAIIEAQGKSTTETVAAGRARIQTEWASFTLDAGVPGRWRLSGSETIP